MFEKDFERCSKPVALPGSVVQLSGDFIAPALPEMLHRSTLREVLANEPVGVLVRSSLPRGIWRSEEDFHTGGFFDLFVPVELRAVVNRDGEEESGMGLNQRNHALVHGDHLAAAKPADDGYAGDSFDKGDHAMIAACADNDVHLPVPDLLAGLDRGRSLGDMTLAWKPTTLFSRAVAFPVADRLAKMFPELATAALVLAHVRVNGLMTDVEELEELEPTADLFGAEIIANECLDQRPLDLAEVAVPS